jgi:hypothetical protein
VRLPGGRRVPLRLALAPSRDAFSAPCLAADRGHSDAPDAQLRRHRPGTAQRTARRWSGLRLPIPTRWSFPATAFWLPPVASAALPGSATVTCSTSSAGCWRMKAAEANPAISPRSIRFCDTLWLEDGLARASLDSYRSDLLQLPNWLAEQQLGSLCEHRRSDPAAFVATLSQTCVLPRRRVICRRCAASTGTNWRAAGASSDPTLRIAMPAKPSRLAESALRGAGRAPARRAAQRDDARPA